MITPQIVYDDGDRRLRERPNHGVTVSVYICFLQCSIYSTRSIMSSLLIKTSVRVPYAGLAGQLFTGLSLSLRMTTVINLRWPRRLHRLHILHFTLSCRQYSANCPACGSGFNTGKRFLSSILLSHSLSLDGIAWVLLNVCPLTGLPDGIVHSEIEIVNYYILYVY